MNTCHERFFCHLIEMTLQSTKYKKIIAARESPNSDQKMHLISCVTLCQFLDKNIIGNEGVVPAKA